MKTQYFTATSLDGFLATEDDSLDWLFTLGSLEESSYPAFIAQVRRPPAHTAAVSATHTGLVSAA